MAEIVIEFTSTHVKHGWTALMWATDKDNLEMVELLLANKADTNVPAKVSHSSMTSVYFTSTNNTKSYVHVIIICGRITDGRQ